MHKMELSKEGNQKSDFQSDKQNHKYHCR